MMIYDGVSHDEWAVKSSLILYVLLNFFERLFFDSML